jgi:hypothetical protein
MRTLALLLLVPFAGCSVPRQPAAAPDSHFPISDWASDFGLRFRMLAESDELHLTGSYEGWWFVSFPGDRTTLELNANHTFVWTPVEDCAIGNDDGSGEIVGYEPQRVTLVGKWQILNGSVELSALEQWQGRTTWRFYSVDLGENDVLIPDIFLEELSQRDKSYRPASGVKRETAESRGECIRNCGYRRKDANHGTTQPLLRMPGSESFPTAASDPRRF